MLLVLSLALGVVGAVGGTLLARYSAHRSTKQPVSAVVEDERKVLGALLAHPGMQPAFAELTPEMFAVDTHRKIWQTISVETAAGVAEDLEELRRIESTLSANLRAKIVTELSGQDPRLAEIALELEGKHPGIEAYAGTREDAGRSEKKAFDTLLKSGMLIQAAAADREGFAGRSPIEHVGTSEKPFVRKYETPSRSRTLFTAMLTAFGAALVPFLVLERTPIETTTAQLVAGAAILLMLTSSVVVALVDWDTLYLDLPVFWLSGIAIWALAVTAQLLDQSPGRLLQGLLAIVVMLVVVEGFLRLYAKLRGLPMQGGGDTQILLVTAGVPAALSGSVLVGLFGGLLAAAVTALVVYGILWSVGRFKKDEPFAYGPFLALGWVLGWVATPVFFPEVMFL